MQTYKLIIRFPDQSKSFTYGVEYGRLLARMERGDMSVTNDGFPVRIENIQLLRDTCTEYGYIPHFGVRYYGELVEFTAIKYAHANN
jgi:hypothetical protein